MFFLEEWGYPVALRLLEIIIPEQHYNDVSELLEHNEITDFWQTCSCESKVIFKIILRYCILALFLVLV